MLYYRAIISHLLNACQVRNNDAMAVYFWVVAETLGQIPIEVSANAGVGADAVRRKLLVKVGLGLFEMFYWKVYFNIV